MLTIAGGILLAVGIIFVGGFVIAIIGVPIQLFLEHRRFLKTGKRVSRHFDD